MSRSILLVTEDDGTPIGYVQWSNTSDSFCSDIISKTVADAWVQYGSRPRGKEDGDIILRVDMSGDHDAEEIAAGKKRPGGMRVWASPDKAFISDNGCWAKPHDGADFGYADVLDADNPDRIRISR